MEFGKERVFLKPSNPIVVVVGSRAPISPRPFTNYRELTSIQDKIEKQDTNLQLLVLLVELLRCCKEVNF